jgi:signal peptidase II
VKLKVLYPSIILSVFALDQGAKLLIRQRVPLHESIDVIRGFFRIVHIRNMGAVFGLFANSAVATRYHLHSVLGVVTLLLVVLVVRRYPASKPWMHVGFATVAGGALGNLFDRFTRGYVVDFLEFHLGLFTWPAFNVADTAITVGVFLMGCQLLWLDRKEPKERGKEKGETAWTPSSSS